MMILENNNFIHETTIFPIDRKYYYSKAYQFQ